MRLERTGWVVAVVVVLGLIAWSRLRAVEVPVLQVAVQPLEHWVVASGQIRYHSLARVGAEITGTVAQRHVREGDSVEAGQLLVSLRDDDWQAQLEQAQAALDQLHNQLYPQAVQSLNEARLAWQQAEREARRRSELASQDMVAQEQAEQAKVLAQTGKAALRRAELQEQSLQPGGDEERQLQQRLEQARANLEKTRIRAPFAGRVQTRSVEPGDQVQPGRVLLEIARLDGLEVIAAVDEKYMAPLQLGQEAIVIADAWPQHELKAQVSFLAPTVDEASGTLDVHLQVDDPQQLLRQGMTVSASVLVASKAEALVLPRDYLQPAGAHVQVLRLSEGELEPVAVQTGLQTTARIEVVSGVQAGDFLVLPEHVPSGASRLRAGESVQP